MYGLVYQKGFKVTSLFEKTKASLIVQSSKEFRGADLKIFRRQVSSIGTVGIKVGGFHMLERASTPIFLHYVLTNVVNMLVARE